MTRTTHEEVCIQSTIRQELQYRDQTGLVAFNIEPHRGTIVSMKAAVQLLASPGVRLFPGPIGHRPHLRLIEPRKWEAA